MADDSTWSQSSAAISNIGHVIHCVTIVTILKCKHGGDMRRWVYVSLVDIGEHINLFGLGQGSHLTDLSFTLAFRGRPLFFVGRQGE